MTDFDAGGQTLTFGGLFGSTPSTFGNFGDSAIPPFSGIFASPLVAVYGSTRILTKDLGGERLVTASTGQDRIITKEV